MHHDDEKEAVQTTTEEEVQATTEATDELGLDDLGEMDLTVETIEERISPSETNVFDK